MLNLALYTCDFTTGLMSPHKVNSNSFRCPPVGLHITISLKIKWLQLTHHILVVCGQGQVLRKLDICDWSRKENKESYIAEWWMGNEVTACTIMTKGGPE